MSRTLIGCIRFLKDPTNALEFINVILLHTYQRNVSLLKHPSSG